MNLKPKNLSMFIKELVETMQKFDKRPDNSDHLNVLAEEVQRVLGKTPGILTTISPQGAHRIDINLENSADPSKWSYLGLEFTPVPKDDLPKMLKAVLPIITPDGNCSSEPYLISTKKGSDDFRKDFTNRLLKIL